MSNASNRDETCLHLPSVPRLACQSPTGFLCDFYGTRDLHNGLHSGTAMSVAPAPGDVTVALDLIEDLVNRASRILDSEGVSSPCLHRFVEGLVGIRGRQYTTVGEIISAVTRLEQATSGVECLYPAHVQRRIAGQYCSQDEARTWFEIEAAFLGAFTSLLSVIRQGISLGFAPYMGVAEKGPGDQLACLQDRIRLWSDNERELEEVQDVLRNGGAVITPPSTERLSHRDLANPRRERRYALPDTPVVGSNNYEQWRERGFLQGESRFGNLGESPLVTDPGDVGGMMSSGEAAGLSRITPQVQVGPPNWEQRTPAPAVTISTRPSGYQERSNTLRVPASHHVHIHPDPVGSCSNPSLGDVQNILNHSDEHDPAAMIIGTRGKWFLLKRYRTLPMTEAEQQLLAEKLGMLRDLFGDNSVAWGAYLRALRGSGIGVYQQHGTEDLVSGSGDITLDQWSPTYDRRFE